MNKSFFFLITLDWQNTECMPLELKKPSGGPICSYRARLLPDDYAFWMQGLTENDPL